MLKLFTILVPIHENLIFLTLLPVAVGVIFFILCAPKCSAMCECGYTVQRFILTPFPKDAMM